MKAVFTTAKFFNKIGANTNRTNLILFHVTQGTKGKYSKAFAWSVLIIPALGTLGDVTQNKIGSIFVDVGFMKKSSLL
jgi:hypothetical protein